MELTLGANFTSLLGCFVPMFIKGLHYLLQPVLDTPDPEQPHRFNRRIFRLPWLPGRRPRFQPAGPLLLLIGIAGLLTLVSPDQSLMAFNEGIYGFQARWMLEKGDWVTVGWWGNPEFDHPIGFAWLMALSLHWFGVGELAVRIPSMVACWAVVLVTWRLGSYLSPDGGLWGAAILTVLPFWIQASKLGVPHVLFTGLILGMIWALLQGETHPQRQGGWAFWAGILWNASFLVGGTMVILPTLACLPYLMGEHHRHGHLKIKGLYWGLGLGAGPAIVWLSLVWVRHGWSSIGQVLHLPFESLQDTVMGSIAQPLAGSSSVFYYLWHIPAVTLPWFLLALMGTVLLVRHQSIPRKLLWLGYPAIYLALLSLVDQRSDYLALPIYPFLAILAAMGLNYLARLFCSPRRRHYRIAMGFGWGLGVLSVLLISAGGALMITPGGLISNDIKVFGWIGLVVGLGWLVPWLITVNRQLLSQTSRIRREVGAIWQVGWLLGPLFAIATLFFTGLWGNYNPTFKTVVGTPPIATVLDEQVIHFIQPRKEQEDILLSFYTPHLGQRYSNWQEVPTGEYAWGDGQALPLPDDRYQVLGEVNGWQLVKAPEFDPAP